MEQSDKVCLVLGSEKISKTFWFASVFGSFKQGLQLVILVFFFFIFKIMK
jgi:hypothetical protein